MEGDRTEYGSREGPSRKIFQNREINFRIEMIKKKTNKRVSGISLLITQKFHSNDNFFLEINSVHTHLDKKLAKESSAG